MEGGTIHIMTVTQPNGASSSFCEKTISGFMGGDASKGSPQPAKKQTSLLSFFSTPSPKRPIGEIRQELPSSPSKKKVREETPLIASSSFYEMVSESDEEEQNFSPLSVYLKKILTDTL